MSESTEQRSLTPYFIGIGAVVVILVAVLLWPASEPEPEPVVEPVVAQPEPVVETPEPFESTPPPEPVEIEPTEEVEPLPVTPEPEPEPIDTSDSAIKSALTSIATSETFVRLMVDDGLLQRFVVTVTNLADNEMAPNHRLVTPPSQSFRVYQQADREWVDAASFKRYTPYVDALESFDNASLLSLYKRYEEEIQTKYDEIGDPDVPFREVFLDAIDTLLDTPEVKMPIEVYTDSVMYKFADERLESLAAPQKQLLRTGPDNMRRVKAKLRDLKALLEEDGSQ